MEHPDVHPEEDRCFLEIHPEARSEAQNRSPGALVAVGQVGPMDQVGLGALHRGPSVRVGLRGPCTKACLCLSAATFVADHGL